MATSSHAPAPCTSNSDPHLPRGWRWRSAPRFILAAVTLAIFTKTLECNHQALCLSPLIFPYLCCATASVLVSLLNLQGHLSLLPRDSVHRQVVPVLPFALTARAGVNQDQAQYWVSVLLAVYGAALLVGSPPAGWLADRTKSRRIPYLCGLLALAGSTVMLAVGQSLPVLLIGRVFQGFSAAVVWVVGLALLVDAYTRPARASATSVETDPAEADVSRSSASNAAPTGSGLVEALGTTSLGYTIATLIGPLLGGVVYQQAGYLPVFGMAFAVIAVDVFLRLIIIEPRLAKRWIRYSVPLVPQQHDRIFEAATDAVPASQPNTSVKLSSSALPVLLRSRRFLTALWASFVEATNIAAFDAVLPLRVRNVFGWSSTGAGAVFLAVVLPGLCAPLLGRLLDRRAGQGRMARLLAAAGFAVSCPCLVLLRFVDGNAEAGEPGSLRIAVLMCSLLALIGLALAAVITPTLAEMALIVDAKEQAQPGIFGPRGATARAYGLFNMCFAAGCLVGPILGGFIADRVGWATMCWALGLLNGVSAIPVSIWMGGRVKGRRNED